MWIPLVGVLVGSEEEGPGPAVDVASLDGHEDPASVSVEDLEQCIDRYSPIKVVEEYGLLT